MVVLPLRVFRVSALMTVWTSCRGAGRWLGVRWAVLGRGRVSVHWLVSRLLCGGAETRGGLELGSVGPGGRFSPRDGGGRR